MKTTKKILVIVLCLTMLMVLAACEKKVAVQDGAQQSAAVSSAQPSSPAATTPAQTAGSGAVSPSQATGKADPVREFDFSGIERGKLSHNLEIDDSGRFEAFYSTNPDYIDDDRLPSPLPEGVQYAEGQITAEQQAEVAAVMQKYNVNTWQVSYSGSHNSQSGQDGYYWDIELEYNNGKEIDSDGYGAYPEGYDDFRKELYAVFGINI